MVVGVVVVVHAGFSVVGEKSEGSEWSAEV